MLEKSEAYSEQSDIITALDQCVEHQINSSANNWGRAFESRSRQNICLKINMNVIIQGYTLTV